MSTSTRGRKPKPTAVKALEGNPGKRPLPKNEVKPKSPVKRPRGLVGGARKFWDEHAAELEALGVATGWDVPALRMMAEHYAISLEALEQLREDNQLVVPGRYGARVNPLVTVFRNHSEAFKKFAEQFGMTPSARARLPVAPADDPAQLSLVEALFARAEEDRRAAAAAAANVEDEDA